jgi:aryl-alcohol dehydrogenase-like predicted oxidoreductase
VVPRPLGSTGLSVSPIGLGAVKLGRNTDVKYPAGFALPTDQEVETLLQTAYDLGVNLIDTAPAYGQSEARLGRFLKPRSAWIVSTKCGETYDHGRSTYDFSGRSLVASLERSLRRLKTDHVDILLIHSNGHDTEILTETDAVPSLERIKQAGKARAIGISAKTSDGIIAAIPSLDVVMAPYNRRHPSHAPALAQAALAGLGILAIKGLGSGHLANDVESSLRYVLQEPFVHALVIGTTHPDHLRQAAALADGFLRASIPGGSTADDTLAKLEGAD